MTDLANILLTYHSVYGYTRKICETFQAELEGWGRGAVIDGATTLDVSVTNDDVGAPPVNGGGGGGGGAMGIELLGLLGLLLLAVGREPEARRRAEERANQVRLRYHGRA